MSIDSYARANWTLGGIKQQLTAVLNRPQPSFQTSAKKSKLKTIGEIQIRETVTIIKTNKKGRWLIHTATWSSRLYLDRQTLLHLKVNRTFQEDKNLGDKVSSLHVYVYTVLLKIQQEIMMNGVI